MNIRGHMSPLIPPSKEYFAKHCDAPKTMVLDEIEEAERHARRQYNRKSSYADTAVFVDGEVHNDGLFTARTTVLYDPASASEDIRDIFSRTEEQNAVIDVRTATTYHPRRHSHTHNTIHLPHEEIIGSKSPLEPEDDNEPTQRMHGLPTVDDIIRGDYHS